MNKTLLLILTLMLSFQLSAKPKFGLHFDDQGNIIKPDQEFLWRGLEDEKAGSRKEAMNNFMRSAEYGNYHAMSLVGFYHKQDKDLATALAWFKLIDLGKIPNRDYLEELVKNIESVLTADEKTSSDELHKELLETYGNYPTMNKRMEWKDNMRFTGTNIKGYIPPFLKIQLNSGVQITGNDLKRQVENFIFEYEFSLGTGEVTLDEIEIIEVDEEN